MYKRRLSSRAGFTLLEILMVVVIIGFLVTVAAVKMTNVMGTSRRTATLRQIDAYKTTLGVYELDNGFYPSTEQGLQALIAQPSSTPAPVHWKGPYLDPPVLRPDPWGHPYIYKNPGQKLPTGYDLYSVGPNGVEGDDDDIGNWL